MMNTKSTASLLDLPEETLVQIMSYLDIPDVIYTSQTCSLLFALAKEATLWRSLHHRLWHTLPLSKNMPIQDLEQSMKIAYIASVKWSHKRETLVTELHPPRPTQESNFFVQILGNVWLVCLTYDWSLFVWDLSSAPFTLRLHHRLNEEHGYLRTCVASFDDESSWAAEHGSSIVIGVSQIQRTEIYRISVGASLSIELLHVIVGPSALYFIDTSQCILGALNDLVIEIWTYWYDLQDSIYKSSRLVRILPGAGDDTELWNGLTGMKIVDDHILCVRMRTIEVWKLPQKTLSPLTSMSVPEEAATLVYRQSHGATFRYVSFSTLDISTDHLGSRIVKVSFIASDSLKGLFHYHARLLIPSDERANDGNPDIALFSLKLAHVHDLVFASAPVNGPPNQNIQGLRTNGFVSTFKLGHQGMRGLWVERSRESTKRSVYAFSLPRPGLEDSDVGIETDSLRPNANTPRIDGHLVYESESYDLRDDITQCSLSEITGTIILGTRRGSLKVL